MLNFLELTYISLVMHYKRMPCSNNSCLCGLFTFINLFCSGLYYKHVTIVNDASSTINKLKASLNDAARGIIYEFHMFIVQATEVKSLLNYWLSQISLIKSSFFVFFHWSEFIKLTLHPIFLPALPVRGISIRIWLFG